MTGAALDTSGVIVMHSPAFAYVTWPDLAPFVQGYIEAMLEGGALRMTVARYRSGDTFCGFSDLAPETLARIIGDCERVEAVFPGASLTAEDGRRILGHRMAGFPGPLATDDALRAALPPLTPYLGEDGLIYLREVAP